MSETPKRGGILPQLRRIFQSEFCGARCIIYLMQKIDLRQAEACQQDVFRCGTCNKSFSAKIVTWVDAARMPRVKQALLRWEFNIVECPACGCRQFAGMPFLYEDFEEGLLVAVFPRVPEGRGRIEAGLQEKYGHYPVLEFFYDMTQLWMLLYVQEHYRFNGNLAALSRVGVGEQRLRKVLKFLKENVMMIDIREKLTETFFGAATDDELIDLLSRAIYDIEEMRAWPRDQRCTCGGDLSRELKCCDRPVELQDHDAILTTQFVVYCPVCREALAGASCGICGRVYTWKLGTVPSYHAGRHAERGTKKKEHPYAD